MWDFSKLPESEHGVAIEAYNKKQWGVLMELHNKYQLSDVQFCCDHVPAKLWFGWAIENDKIKSGIYNVADDDAISTNELIKIIAECQGKKSFIWKIPHLFIKKISKLGDFFRLPLNSERLQKLTENYIVSNNKIKNSINKPFPLNSKDGLIKTFNSFNNV
jgi:hypothetical protein